MSQRWDNGVHPDMPTLGAADWLRVIARGAVLIVLVFGGLLILLATRLIERPFCGQNRPVTPYITQFVCRNAFRVLGIELHITGAPMAGRGAVVANHSSWHLAGDGHREVVDKADIFRVQVRSGLMARYWLARPRNRNCIY